MKKFLVSTANVYGYDSEDNLLFVGKTLLDSSVETTLSNTDVRAGQGNQLQYIYYHTAEMNITINEAQFSLEFLALNTGSDIVTGASVWTEETVNVANGAGTVSKAPLSVQSQTIYGWVTLADGTVERVTFTGQGFTLSDLTYSDDACVRYYTEDSSARQVTINADMLPGVVRLVMDATLASSDATTNQIGKVQIEVPRASMTGAFTLSMTPDAVSQTPLSVRALSSTKAAGGCTGNRPIYATITEIIDGASWEDGVFALAISGGDFSLAVSGSKALQTFALKSGVASFLAPVSGLTFASDDVAIATVDASGNVTGVAVGTTNITATITSNPDVNVIVAVTVA